LKRVNLRRKWPTIPKATAGGKLNKGKINMKLQNLIHIVIGIVCVGLLANAEAVNPPPDGGYPEANTAEGQNALFSLTTGVANTAVGWLSLNVLDTGKFNTAIGAATLIGNTADQNTATGAGALFNTSTGGNNTANGAFALFENLQAGDNTAIGSHALLSNTTGSNNVALGSGAGASATTGSNNVYVGAGMQGAAGESNACYIKSIFDQTSANGVPILINSNNKLGTTTSSKRFKEEIKPMGTTSEALFSLTPVAFHYKKEIDPAGTPQLGLVAEDVEKINPDLVIRDKEGKPYSVRYDQVNAMLLNEFLKEHKAFLEEHRKNEEQEKTIAELKSGMTALTATVKEQAAQIQKVSAQLEAGKPTPQVVVNNQ
jgi:trimeric autotransporter adhesin